LRRKVALRVVIDGTTLSVTHDMASARKIAIRISMKADGRFILDGALEVIDESGNAPVGQIFDSCAAGPDQMQFCRL